MMSGFSLLCVVLVASTVGTLAFSLAGPPSSARSSAVVVRMAAQPESSSSRYDRMYSPRNDVYFYRPEDIMMQNAGMTPPRRQAQSMQDPDYRSPAARQRGTNPARFDPRNDVFAREPEAYSAELMVEKELAKIIAKGRYAIENELYNIHGMNIERDVHSREELACLLLKARLAAAGDDQGGRNNIINNYNSIGRSNNIINNNVRMNNQPPPVPQQVVRPPSYYAVSDPALSPLNRSS
jgi:hypothetical protein